MAEKKKKVRIKNIWFRLHNGRTQKSEFTTIKRTMEEYGLERKDIADWWRD